MNVYLVMKDDYLNYEPNWEVEKIFIDEALALRHITDKGSYRCSERFFHFDDGFRYYVSTRRVHSE